jgi:SET domain-containing protein
MSSSLYEIRQIPGKGRGLVARSDIPEGTRILYEKPLLMIPDNMPDEELEAQLVRDLKALDKDQQRQFLSLHNIHTGKYVFGGIFKTNSLACSSKSSSIAVFPTISLINHSCLPNSHYDWNESLEMQTIHVTRDVSAGEEITICYTDSGNATTRQAYLKEHFGFDCSCQVCSLPAVERNASDARREEISRLQDVFATTDRAMSEPEEAFRDLRKLVNILNKVHGFP